MNFLLELTRRVFGADIYSARVCANCEDDLIRFCGVSYETNAPYCLVCVAKRENWSPVELWNALKLSVGCEVCGYAFSRYGLEGDHLDATKKYRTKSGKVVEWSDLLRNCSLTVANSELANIQVLCGTHHAEKTETERIPELHARALTMNE